MPVPKVAMLAADGVERRDVEALRRALEDADRRVDLVAVQRGEVWAMDGLDKAATFPVDVTLRDARAGSYESLVIP
ncbi:MAG TPA: DJ-1/PfpI family protein, partial [Solirubrobacterales bacterium]